MTEKQRKCISWICNVLDIEYQLSDSGFDAWRFIDRNKPLAEAKVKEWNDNKVGGEMAADLFVLGLLAKAKIPIYSSGLALSERGSRTVFNDEWDLKNLEDSEIDELCPGGINCKDDMDDHSWMFAMRDNLYF